MLTRAEATTIILRLLDKTLRKSMFIGEDDINNIKLEDLMSEPVVEFVYNEMDEWYLNIYLRNWEDYSKDAEFKIEFPNNLELYKWEIPINGIGEYYTNESVGSWRGMWSAERTSIYAITDTHDISNEYIENKEKLEKIKAGYNLCVIVTVRDNIKAFAFPTGIERPTYYLDCEKNNVHNRLFKDRTGGCHVLWVLKR